MGNLDFIFGLLRYESISIHNLDVKYKLTLLTLPFTYNKVFLIQIIWIISLSFGSSQPTIFKL